MGSNVASTEESQKGETKSHRLLLVASINLDTCWSGSCCWGGLFLLEPPPDDGSLFGRFKAPWLAIQGRILTMDNLCRRKMIVINACSLCLAVEESTYHLLIHCDMENTLWIGFSENSTAVGCSLSPS
ncbi:serine/threonine-protein phosphatase 4 regulatory subunit 3-like protein isoform X1 [Cinnamomum micranthum f. kanehirae]|uniref:Serine/threonine-protein phosphatase 4 regulatory subunit 3-like protein isoform X1 n=1 Tax=Cinnamomum micranthum f. kanehirae TaxID=337451 RepID=A0A3S3NCZ3_9MAGN|nr:serine/threonine-protein phosphatase 4 regulatory subunit 3-like protein isoform X1 [Cinnamomum micranthum f. kanehirae]